MGNNKNYFLHLQPKYLALIGISIPVKIVNTNKMLEWRNW